MATTTSANASPTVSAKLERLGQIRMRTSLPCKTDSYARFPTADVGLVPNEKIMLERCAGNFSDPAAYDGNTTFEVPTYRAWKPRYSDPGMRQLRRPTSTLRVCLRPESAKEPIEDLRSLPIGDLPIMLVGGEVGYQEPNGFASVNCIRSPVSTLSRTRHSRRIANAVVPA